MTERLWAPWRLEYIKEEKTGECIFCTKPGENRDEETYVVHRGKLAFVILNTFPYNNGHLMVAPYEHVDALEKLEAAILSEIMQLAQQALKALKAAYGPEGFNIGFNQGKVSGAGLEHHLHLHIVPRWAADTNFMPVLGNTRVLPQVLSESYATLKENWPKCLRT